MKPDEVAEIIEKLIDEKLKLSTILLSKSLGTHRETFLEDTRRRITELRTRLANALKEN